MTEIKFKLLSSLNNCVSINGHAVDDLVLYLEKKNMRVPNLIGQSSTTPCFVIFLLS